jgi:MFS family permease
VSLFRHADFRRLFAGDSFSQLGMLVGMTAIPLLAATVLAATPFEMGLLTAAEQLGFLLIGLPAGVWVDRMRRRRLMIAADFTRAALILSIPIAWWLGVLTLGQVIAAVLLTGIATVFFDVSYQSYLPFLVGREHLVEGNAKLQAVQSTAVLAGPSAAGVLVQLVSAASTVLLTGLGYLGSALCLLRISAREPKPERAAHERALPQMLEGLRFVFGNTTLRAITLCTATANLCTGIFDAVRVLFLARTIGLSPAVIGAIFAVSGAGGILAALCSGPIIRRVGQARSIWLIPLLAWPLNLLFPLVTPGWGLAFAVISGISVGFGIIIYNVAQVSYRQAICPDRLLGRMNASVRFVVWGASPVGGFLGGVLGEAIGLVGTVWVGIAGQTASMLWVLFSPLFRMRDLPVAEKTGSLAT